MALILLIVLSFAGLLAARQSAGIEAAANNGRITQVARLMAEKALRHCEDVVIDTVDNEGRLHGKDGARIATVAAGAPDDDKALWRSLANWADNAPNVIAAPVAADGATHGAVLAGVPQPRCMVQPLPDSSYLITARGLSAGAEFDAQGQLVAGSEVWLQSVITPQIPVRSHGGGYE